jgi:RsiW-degrading membrane proteinase PrsW (M82 family)
MNTLLITIAPSILILLYFFLSDKFKEPKGTVFLVFFLGILICLPAGILNSFIYENFNNNTETVERLLGSFLGPAWTEELLKLFILYAIVLKRKEFNEPMDGIVYGVAVSLGFATYENYDYVYRLALEWKEYDITPQDVAIWRSYSAVPMHGLNGCLMGFYLGKYVFTGDKKFLNYSFFAPFFMHGIYNYYIQFGVFIVIVQLIFALRLHKELKKLQLLKKKEPETKKI